MLNISRAGLYYEPVATSAEDLDLMRRIDKLHLKWPHLGSRKLAKELGKQGLRVQPQARAALDAAYGDRGAGASCLDNVFVERLWRSLKYEEVYLHAYRDLIDARAGIGRYFDYYNYERDHQALGYRTPDAFYRAMQPMAA